MAKNLLIVESPAKAKTIEKYLGKDFKVKSSFGHIRDLDKGSKGVDIENDFEPSYVVSPEKRKVVKDLKDWVSKVDEVWLATDEDREGEAISWHLCKELGLDEMKTKRIVFREITKPAIQSAIEKPRKVDINLVNAQQARRILDRLVGFELSETLWRKVKGKLSAGRVQSVAVKLIVEKEREIRDHVSENYYKVVAVFEVDSGKGGKAELKADLKNRIPELKEAEAFLEKSKGSKYSITSIDIKPTQRKPAPPFTTSTLQQEASRKLGFSVNRTMSAAQKLYEQGLITYMRTDSNNLSDIALQSIEEQIVKEYGKEYSTPRKYKSKNSSAQEAHEAIRPTYIENQGVGNDRDQQRLYELIWKRTIASQMSNAKIEKTEVKIASSKVADADFRASGEVLKFEGFLKVYIESNDDDEEEEAKGMLPPLHKGQQLDLKELQATERFTRPPARYTEASLVKKLEELGIGRPSTYAPTITKIMEKDRGYVTKESREGEERKYQYLTLAQDQIKKEEKTEITGSTSNRLYSTDIGMVVTDFLEEHFGGILEYGFTADIEEEFDVIAEGGKEWKEMLRNFYNPFHDKVEETIANADRAKGKRELGKDPKTGHTVLVQITRYGPVVQIGTREEVGEDGKPQFANLKPGQSMETISYEDAMELFKLPRVLGEYKGEELSVNSGRYGPYVKYGEKKFVSLPKGGDPLEITKEEALELVKQKEKEDAPIGTYKGVDITKGRGRFGPFLKYGSLYVNVPKRYDFDNISIEDAHDLIAKKIEKEANRYIQQWPDEKISIENARWGPVVKFGRKFVKIPKKGDDKLTAEDLKEVSLEEVKKWIEAELPGSFKDKKKATTKKKPAAKKKATSKKK
ncbi:type I DNA topoisomerase [Portibacter marinus]|uniref:type I DNA topoisomerase n=1 Tax=Portibacter marinus TaxID=2898660 RepID=UPI001F001627|nr:type I DNA topoisomerase [Portibacter marinus]